MRKVVLSVAVIAALIGINFLVTKYANGYVERVILLSGIYVILAVSLNLVNGFTGQFSLGHAGFFGIGAYIGAAVSVFGEAGIFRHWFDASGQTTWLHGGILLVLSMLAGGMVAAAAGWIVGLPSLKLKGDYLAIVTLGFNQIIVVLLNNWDTMGGPRGFNGIERGESFIFIPSLTSFFWVFLAAAAVIALSMNLRNSVHGLAFVSIREDEFAAEAMGVPTTRYKVVAFVLGAFFAGVAGALFAHMGYIKPDQFNFIVSINIVIMVVLGGMGSVTGTALGALLLTALPEYLRNVSPAVDEYRLVIFALLLIVLMLLRPQGIFGHDELGRAWLKKQWVGICTLPRRVRFPRRPRPSVTGTQP